ncbi:MAG: flagellar motor switch protein FliG [Nitrospiraceae bacterium]|nr:flagellar motor switch protein FliG [Nitrospiraceae bacterium]
MMSGYEKAAIFLTSLGEEAAAQVLKGLDMEDIKQITMHMAKLKSLNRGSVQEVINEAQDFIAKGDIYIKGDEFMKRALLKGLGEASAGKVLEDTAKDEPLESLKWVDTKTLVNFLVTEHPQTIALIISLLEPQKAAEVLSSLPESLKSDVSYRIAMTERIPESTIEDLNDVLKGHLDVSSSKGKKLEGTKTIAEILNHCDKATEQKLLEQIEGKSSSLADSIRQLMFVFDDLVRLDDKGIQALLKEVATEDLTLALKTASKALKDKIFKNMSQRASELLKEEMQTRGPARVSDVEKAQLKIVKAARKMEAEGRIILVSSGGEELVE